MILSPIGRARLSVAILALAACVALTPAFAATPQPVASASRPPSATPTPALTRRERVISFLDRVITWYHNLNTEVALAEQPSEMLYVNDDRNLADSLLQVAFQYARAEAELLKTSTPATTADKLAVPTPQGTPGLAALAAQTKTTIESDQRKIAQIRAELTRAKGADRANLASRLVALQADLQWQQARAGYIGAMQAFEHGGPSATLGQSDLDERIDELQRAVSAAQVKLPSPTFNPPPEPTGVISLAQHLLEDQRRLQLLDGRQAATQALATQSRALAAPLRQQLMELDRRAIALSHQALGSDPASLEERSRDFAELIEQRKLIAEVLLPLGELGVAINRYSTNLGQWHAVVVRHMSQGLHALVARLAGLLFLIALIIALSLIWRHLTMRYVSDNYRRRQLLKIRDITVLCLIALVLIFNFTTELAALATILGFAAAGIAVALQDVILSLAGYFRLSGRYGMKRGDRVELLGVRGEVLEIGLTKLTLIELGSDSSNSSPTGRLVVIPNSSIFHDKFVNHPPDTRLIWNELSFTLAPECDYRVIEKLLLEVVEEVFARYRDRARRQLLAMERTIDTSVESPKPQSRLRLRADGLEITLRYPVEASYEAQVTDEISRRLLDTLARQPNLRFVPSSAPNIQVNTAPVVGDAELVPSQAKAE
ncbi:MAG TPA: mechanosensitive ion channel domain-containing protein [Candidatus Binataceae bacterium]|nr:mechanosensitive ion channel domain-containing protein [Candidatus Binataceae bacterium]